MPILEEIPNETAELWVNRYTDSLRQTRMALGIALAMSAACVGLVVMNILTLREFRRPLVYRIDDKHRAVVERYSAVAEGWSETDARADVEDFLRYYLARDRETIGSPSFGFSRSLWYLSSALASKAKQASQIVNKGACFDGGEDCTVATYLADGTAPDVSIRIGQTVIQGFRQTGEWQALVTFWKDLDAKLGGVRKSILCTATVTAEYLDGVPEEYLPSDRNPRGLVISDLKITQGYAE